MLGPFHAALATAALILGAAVLWQPKGGQRHRRAGRLYTATLLLVNVTALAVYDQSGRINAFHVLALVSLATLSGGFVPVFLRRPQHRWLELHAYFISWSYVGLVAAGAAQIATMVSGAHGPLTVGLSSLAVVLIGGVWIHTRIPRSLTGVVLKLELRRDPSGREPLSQQATVANGCSKP